MTRMLRFTYGALTAFSLMVVGSTTITTLDIIPAVILMWLCYLVFSILHNQASDGYSAEVETREIRPASRTLISTPPLPVLLVIASVVWSFSMLAARHYSGHSATDVLSALLSGSSLYAEYQQHFAEGGLAALSVSKLPYVLMLAANKLVLVWSFVVVFLLDSRARASGWVFVLVLSGAHLYFGFSRGTNFEVFEVVALVLFVSFLRRLSHRTKLKPLVGVLLAASAGVYLFARSIEARSGFFSEAISADISYDPKGVVVSLLPGVAILTVGLFSYFGFGIFYISRQLTEIVLVSLPNLLMFLVPFGPQFTNYRAREAMGEVVDMGARWHPDAGLIIGSTGLVGLLLFAGLLGHISGTIGSLSKDPALLSLQFFIFLQMFSLPIGNFVSVSSENWLSVAFLASLVVVNYIRRGTGGRNRAHRRIGGVRPRPARIMRSQ